MEAFIDKGLRQSESTVLENSQLSQTHERGDVQHDSLDQSSQLTWVVYSNIIVFLFIMVLECRTTCTFRSVTPPPKKQQQNPKQFTIG